MQVNPIKAGNLRNKIKGFTLVELIIVIAILMTIMGTSVLAMRTFIQNSKLEALNDRAHLVYMAFQDILLDCEIAQDNSVFEPRGKEGAERIDDITGAVIFFRVSKYDFDGHSNSNGAAGLGDEIHIMTTHKNVSPNHFWASDYVCSRSVWAEGSTSPHITDWGYGGANPGGDHGAWYWKKLNQYISARLDDTATGSYVVSVDLENYQVLSVVCRDVPADGRDPKTGLYVTWELSDPTKGLGNYISWYGETSDETKVLISNGVDVTPPQQTFIVKNKEQQRAISNRIGVNMGAYPYGDDIYGRDIVENPMH